MSQIVMAMEPQKDRIIRHMRTDPKLKDDDKALLKSIWKEDVLAAGFDLRIMNASALMDLFIEGKLSNSESIRRMRQKIQEEMPEMRGQKYADRHKQGKEVAATINDPVKIAALKNVKPVHKPKFSI